MYHCPWTTKLLLRAMFQAYGYNNQARVTADDVRGVVGGHDMVCVVVHPCQMWSIPHISLIKQCDSISIPVSSSLGHYRTDKVNYAGCFV